MNDDQGLAQDQAPARDSRLLEAMWGALGVAAGLALIAMSVDLLRGGGRRAAAPAEDGNGDG